MIKTIIFDFGDVLVTDTAKVYREKYVSTLPKKLQEKCLEFFHQDDLGKTTPNQLCRLLSEKITPQLKPKAIGIILDSPKLIRNTWRLANRLSKKHKVVILSNCGKYCQSIFSKKLNTDFYKFPFISSAKTGMSKPDPRFYRYVIRKFRLDPAETLFIDDHIENLNPAKQLGIRTYHYDQNYPKLIRHLKKLGLQF